MHDEVNFTPNPNNLVHRLNTNIGGTPTEANYLKISLVKRKRIDTYSPFTYHVNTHHNHYSLTTDLDTRYSHLFASFAPKSALKNAKVLIKPRKNPGEHNFGSSVFNDKGIQPGSKRAKKNVYSLTTTSMIIIPKFKNLYNQIFILFQSRRKHT